MKNHTGFSLVFTFIGVGWLILAALESITAEGPAELTNARLAGIFAALLLIFAALLANGSDDD